MRMLFVAPPAVIEHDPLATQILSRWTEREKGRETDVVSTKDEPRSDVEYDRVVLYDEAWLWFYRQRMKINGRFKVLAAPFRHADLLSMILTAGSPLNSGVDMFLTSSTSFIHQMTRDLPTMPVWFMHRPSGSTEPVPKEKRPVRFGTYVDAVEDQDFSLVNRVKEKGGSVKIYVAAEEDLPKLPEAVRALGEVWALPGDPYHLIVNYVPAPRVTDYLGLLVPAELTRAAARGCKILAVAHEAVKPLSQYVPPVASLRELDEKIEAICQFPNDDLPAPELPPAFTPTAEEFVTRMEALEAELEGK